MFPAMRLEFKIVRGLVAISMSIFENFMRRLRESGLDRFLRDLLSGEWRYILLLIPGSECDLSWNPSNIAIRELQLA